MTLPDLYLDEDAQSGPLIRALRSRGLSVITTSEAGMPHSADEEQLRFAASRNMVLVTWFPSMPFDLIVIDEAGHRERLAHSAGFYDQIVERGLRLI